MSDASATPYMSNAIIPAISVGSLCVTPQGVLPPSTQITIDECGAWLEGVRNVEEALPLAIGDVLNLAEQWYGDAWTQVIPEDKQSWQKYKWVAAAVPFGNRIAGLSYAHYRTVAALDVETQRDLLERTAAEGWSTRVLSREVKGEPQPQTIEYECLCPHCEWPLLIRVTGKDVTLEEIRYES